MNETARHPSSYRDPSGYLFHHRGRLLRQVNRRYAPEFEHLLTSGLYQNLVNAGRIVPHQQVAENLTGDAEWYTTLEPERVPFISYPFEWSFSQLKDAALLTLDLAEEGTRHGMLLKDASAYNIQWHEGRLRLIDSLSFERWQPEQPWVAYRQFCEQFLAPLALMHYRRYPLSPLFLAYPNGWPLSLCQALLPWRSRLNLHTYLHLHLQAKVTGNNTVPQKAQPFSATKLKNLLRSLREAVEGYKLEGGVGVWSAYYEEANRREGYVEQKKAIIDRWLSKAPPTTALDLGANEGTFTELLIQHKATTVSVDFDHLAIDRLYRKARASQWPVLPLVMDLSAPSPAMGVNNQEWPSFAQRSQVDLVLALALIHHLCLGKNIPFADCVAFFQSFGPRLLIEYVPKEDEKVKLMLARKEDIYDWYTPENFKAVFGERYRLLVSEKIGDSGRELFLFEAKIATKYSTNSNVI